MGTPRNMETFKGGGGGQESGNDFGGFRNLETEQLGKIIDDPRTDFFGGGVSSSIWKRLLGSEIWKPITWWGLFFLKSFVLARRKEEPSYLCTLSSAVACADVSLLKQPYLTVLVSWCVCVPQLI